MIELTGLRKQFDGFAAVDGVTLTVAPGEILALLGPNGAGKTTTVRMLAAILRPSGGRALVAGFDTTLQPQEVRRRVGVLTEHPGLYLRMRSDAYLDFFGRLMGLEACVRKRRANELMERFGLPVASHRQVGTYSKGMRQKMALVRAMLHDPPVLLLDEPSSAMDPHSAKVVRDAIVSLRNKHRSIIICTHNLAEAEAVSDRIAIIKRGKIVERGTTAELKSRLLGPPLIELSLSQPCDGAVRLISDLVAVETRGEDWIRYSAVDPRVTNPILVQRLAGAGVGVVALSEVPRSLEDVYLRVVGE